MVFRRLIAVTSGLLRMPVRDKCLMRSMRVVFLKVALRCLTVMYRRLFMMLRGGYVVLCAGKNFGHGSSNFLNVLAMWPRVSRRRTAVSLPPYSSRTAEQKSEVRIIHGAGHRLCIILHLFGDHSLGSDKQAGHGRRTL